jgi:hypothetical protein
MRHTFVVALLATGLAACADGPRADSDGPRVTGVSKKRVVVGETLEFYGHGFLNGDAGTTRLRFQGEYVDDLGHHKRVPSFTVTPLPDGTLGDGDDAQQVLRWSRFGPFANPFDDEDRPGIFDGFVVAENVDAHGVVTPDTDPERVQIEVLPSLIVDELQPLGAQCKAPALRILAGIPYHLTVRAVGMRPVRFEYELSSVNGTDGAVRFTHEYSADGPVTSDTLGQDEAILFNPVADADQFYVTGIRVVATDAEGRTVETALPITVHRPIEVVYGGRREMAERYEPVPVSGCIPGSPLSRVSYAETRSETRQRSVSVTVSTDFTQSHGLSQSQHWLNGIDQGETHGVTDDFTDTEEENSEQTYGVSYGHSQANDVGFSSTDGESWGWNMSQEMSNEEYASQMNAVYGEGNWSGTVGVEGEGSIPGFAKVTGKASTTVGVRAGAEQDDTVGGSRRDSSSRGYSMNGSHSDTQSFGSTTTDDESHSLSGTYALTQGHSASQSDSASRSNTRTWTVDGEVSQDHVVAQGDSNAEEHTWESSQTDETVQSFSGLIPAGAVGIFYRQTTRWVRRAEVRSYNLCGMANFVGELQFNEWTWAPDLAIARSCDDQPPPSKLPPAACLIEPCGG